MPDLASALATGRRRALTVLTDACTIRTDPDRNDDATLDPSTLVLTDPDDASTIFTGRCLLSTQSTTTQTTGPATTQETPRQRLRLPFDAPIPPAAAVVTVTASLDPALIGARLRVVDTDFETLSLFRTVTVEPVL